jgi:Kdo2-lipid IVA lauroyltransferase/acyltransferase
MLGIIYFIAHLPVRLNIFLGKCIASLLYRVASSRRRIAEANIALCFPELDDAAQATLVRQVFDSCGIGFFETAMSLWGPSARLQKRHTISGLEHIHAAQAQGKGVLLVGCHMTTLDIAGRMLAFHTQVDFLYRQDPNPLLAYMLIKAREGFYGEAIITVETRKLVNNLRAGRTVWYAPDQDYGIKHSIFAPFFGIPAATVPGTARFAKLGKAVVIPFFHYRDDNGHYRVELRAPLENFPSGDDLADVTRVNQCFEHAIRAKPEQYLWVHRRFKTRPAGQAGFYSRKPKSTVTVAAPVTTP